MKRFVEGEDRRQATLLPDSLDDYVTEDNPVRIVDVLVDELDLAGIRRKLFVSEFQLR
jgi:transposase